MTRSFELTFDSPAGAEAIHSAFAEEEYWHARMAEFGGAKVLRVFDVASDGTVRVTITEDLRRGLLPGILGKVYRGDLNVVASERWHPLGDGRISGAISVAATGAPGSGLGVAVLSPVRGGSRLSLSATVEFTVPLVGSRIEAYVAAEFARGLEQIQRFTTAWIGAHA
jgi:hypothetical protein